MDQQDDASGAGGAGFGQGEVAPAELDAGTGGAHATRVAVWDAPPAVECGGRFAVRVGVTCSAKSRPDGWRVEVRDHTGARRATATLDGDRWPGTDALYHTAVALVAPDTEGSYTWEAAALTDPGPGTGAAAATGAAVATGPAVATGATATTSAAAAESPAAPHAQCSTLFRVRVVPAPECLLTVVATNAESGSPVEGARVVAHPYRAVTDARGAVELSDADIWS